MLLFVLSESFYRYPDRQIVPLRNQIGLLLEVPRNDRVYAQTHRSRIAGSQRTGTQTHYRQAAAGRFDPVDLQRLRTGVSVNHVKHGIPADRELPQVDQRIGFDLRRRGRRTVPASRPAQTHPGNPQKRTCDFHRFHQILSKG